MTTPNHPDPHHLPPRPSLLEEDALIMQQVTGIMSNNFDIMNQQGEVVGVIQTTGSAAARFLLGSRSLYVTEADGRAVLSVEDTVNFGRDTYELADATGQPLAHLRKRFTFFRRQVDMHLADGTVVELHGSIWDFDFEFRVGERMPARVSRKWAGLGRGLLGHSQYALQFEGGVPHHLRAAIIGGVVALDLIRAKDEKN